MAKQQDLLKEFGYFAQSARTPESLMEQIVQRLHVTMTRYNWVGFFLVNKSRPGYLVLGPNVGSFTPPDDISMDKGLNGAAASSRRTLAVNNVAADPRYISGSELVKSEIIAPVLVKGSLYGQLDINSYFANTFTPEEQQFVEACAALVGSYLEKTR